MKQRLRKIREVKCLEISILEGDGSNEEPFLITKYYAIREGDGELRILCSENALGLEVLDE